MDINKIKKPIYTDDRSDSHLDRPHLIQRAIINQNNTNNYKVEQNNNIQNKRFNHSDETQKKIRTNQRVVYNPKTLTSKIQTTKQLAPGEDSTNSVDPVGEFVVGNAVLSPVFKAVPYIKSEIFNLIKKTSPYIKSSRNYTLNNFLDKTNLLKEPNFNSEIPNNNYSDILIDRRFNLGQYLNTDNTHTIVTSGLKPLNEKSTYAFQANIPDSYYSNLADKVIDSNTASDWIKYGIDNYDVKNLDKNDIIDYLTDGSQDIKNTNLNNLLRTQVKNYFNSPEYNNRIRYGVGPIDGFLNYSLKNSSYRDISDRLMSKVAQTKPGYATWGTHTGFVNKRPLGLNLFNNMHNRNTPNSLQTYYHEVGGHGTEDVYGVDNFYDPTLVSNKIKNKIFQNMSTEEKRTSKIQNYLDQPNEMRARGTAVNIFQHSYPDNSFYLKSAKNKNINVVPVGSQLDQLLDSFNFNLDATNDYINQVYKQGGKLNEKK